MSIAVVLSVAGVLALAGCANDSLAQQYRDGSDKGYVAGTGVTEYPADHRGRPVEFTGTTSDGQTFSSQAQHGRVIVVNFWWAGCGPCRQEATELEKIYTHFRPDGVVFIGVNVRDQAADVNAFDHTFGVTYPSILDAGSGATQLAFSKVRPPNSTPDTMVLNKNGQVTATMLGSVTEQPSTLTTLIQSALAAR